MIGTIMMILTNKSKKVIRVAAILGASGVLLSGLSAVFFAPQPTSSPVGSQTVQTDANGNAVIPSQTGQ